MTHHKAISLDHLLVNLLHPPTKTETVGAMKMARYLQETQEPPTSLVGKCVFHAVKPTGFGLVLDVQTRGDNENHYKVHLDQISYWALAQDLMVFVQVIDDDV